MDIKIYYYFIKKNYSNLILSLWSSKIEYIRTFFAIFWIFF